MKRRSKPTEGDKNRPALRLSPLLAVPLYATLTVNSEMEWITDEGRQGS
jgi:hypothetical protein